MKVFSESTFVLEFDRSASFKDKLKWKQKITDNGGVISYILSKKVGEYSQL